MFALVASLVLFPTADEKVQPNPRQVAEKYLAAALADKPEEAIPLALEGRSTAEPETIKKLREVVAGQKLSLPTVLFSDKKGYALAVSDEIAVPEGANQANNRGVLVFTLKKNAGGAWLVKDIDVRGAKATEEEVKKAKKLFEDGKEIPPSKS
ncbi:hypothetical protein [Frigoriglobus tundricola]|uniref:DUF4878 domain-containing protein n=1 Tax=Frigoriglobus tundricola TaxID=2774151 RepID=A0A6M5YT27_9BACT|nr:hypothetical protein [Frigoriglobus tundricola]QJW96550.1 hypothetical protein FTUN_4107 [Frigoriglobus tundricola]